jgi:hypothetical protein
LSEDSGLEGGSVSIQRQQLLITYSALVRYWRKTGVQWDLFIDFKKAYDLIRRAVQVTFVICGAAFLRIAMCIENA